MEFHSHKAIFEQIADLMMDGILQKKWNINERIPSVREFAASLEVNPNTVMRAYSFLQDQEIIANKRGIGFFVLADSIDKILELKKKEFIRKDVPLISKSMKLLNLSFDELKQLLDSFED